MADKIQLSIEFMIPDVEKLFQLGYFTKSEAKKLVKKRRFHEYQFEKKDVSKFDYFKAIKFEKIMDKRRKSKKKLLKLEKNEFVDYHFLRRIVHLYRKMTKKFSKDKEIWMEYFHFLIKHKCVSTLNQDIGQCLSRFPSELEFWKIAAYNEFENNSNAMSARATFQKCLRQNKESLDAYLEYFVFELKFVQKLLERKAMLEGKEKQIKFVDRAEDKENKPEANDNSPEDEIIKLKIPESIFLTALEAEYFQDKPQLCLQFLQSLMKYGGTLSYKPLKQLIITVLRTNKNPNYTEIHLETLIANASLIKHASDLQILAEKTFAKYKKLYTKFSEKSEVLQGFGALFQTNPDLCSLANNQEFYESFVSNFNLLMVAKDYNSKFTVSVFEFLLTFFFECLDSSFGEAIGFIFPNIFSDKFSLELKPYLTCYFKYKVFYEQSEFMHIADQIMLMAMENPCNKVQLNSSIQVIISIMSEDIAVDPTKIKDYLDKLTILLRKFIKLDLRLVSSLCRSIVLNSLENISEYETVLQSLKSFTEQYLVNISPILKEFVTQHREDLNESEQSLLTSFK